MIEIANLIEVNETYETIRKLCAKYAEDGTQMTVSAFWLQNRDLKTQWNRPIKSVRGMGSAISAAWRYTQKHYGDEAADHIAVTFIDPRTGELVWKKYHD